MLGSWYVKCGGFSEKLCLNFNYRGVNHGEAEADIDNILDSAIGIWYNFDIIF